MSQRRETKSNTQLSAATALLDLTCDAVVELNGDLRLVSHSSKLAAVLLRNRPGATMEGTKFTDLVAPTDFERVTELLRRDSGGRTYATAFRMHLVDSCASKFQTEVFQVKYTTAGGQKRHIIGLRQDGAQVKFACVWMCLSVWLILDTVCCDSSNTASLAKPPAKPTFPAKESSRVYPQGLHRPAASGCRA